MRIAFLLFVFLSFGLKAQKIDTSFLMDKVILAHQIQDEYPDSAFEIAKEVVQYSNVRNYQEGLAYAYLRLGHLFNVSGQNDSALFYTNQAYQIRKARKDLKGAIGASFTLSNIYNEIGKKDSAFAILYQAVEMGKFISDSLTKAQIHLALGQLLRNYEKYKESVKELEKAIKLNTSIQNKYLNIQLHDALGSTYYESNKVNKALQEYQIANKLLVNSDYINALILNQNNLANCYIKLKQFDQAKSTFLAIIDQLKKKNRYPDLALAFYNLGVHYTNYQDYDSALYYLDKSYDIAYTTEDINRQAACEAERAACYDKTGKYDLAYTHQHRYKVLSDSLMNMNKISLIEELNTKYETEKKEQQIELLNQKNKAQQAERNFMLAASVVLLLAFISLGIYFIQRNRIAKRNARIAQQEMEAVLDEQEIKTYNAMLEGQEEERMRIATDLHDRLGSMLSTVKLTFSSIEDKLGSKANENRNQFSQANSLIDEACIEVRKVSHNLGSGMVANFGLKRALEELCERIDHTGKVKCNFLAHNLTDGYKLETEVSLYRIAQEAVNNAIKHAKAKTITVQLNDLDEELSLQIEDDGVGFETDKFKTTEGMGLANLEQRAQKIGGNFHLDSSPGKGTTIIVEVPLNTDKA